MQTKSDEFYMRKCIQLADKSIDSGEWPFACIIVANGHILAQSINGTIKNQDISSHAEILALRKAQKKLKFDLSECYLYSNCEPCSMCALIIRALKIKRVIFSLPSPYMGGFTKWPILQDPNLEAIKDTFRKPPEVVSGILADEAKKTFHRAGWGEMLKKG